MWLRARVSAALSLLELSSEKISKDGENAFDR
jgi:hypothetical protein